MALCQALIFCLLFHDWAARRCAHVKKTRHINEDLAEDYILIYMAAKSSAVPRLLEHNVKIQDLLFISHSNTLS